MNKCIVILTIIGITFVTSCHKDDSPTSPSTTEGAFVVDSIATTVTVKTDTLAKRLATFITLSLVYHFDNYLGELNNITLFMSHSYGAYGTIDYLGPESINDHHRWNQVLQFPDSLNGQDSIKVLRGLSGTFWEKDSGNVYHITGKFSWNDSLLIIVNR